MKFNGAQPATGEFRQKVGTDKQGKEGEVLFRREVVGGWHEPESGEIAGALQVGNGLRQVVAATKGGLKIVNQALEAEVKRDGREGEVVR